MFPRLRGPMCLLHVVFDNVRFPYTVVGCRYDLESRALVRARLRHSGN